MYIGVWPEYHVAKLVAKAHAKHSRSPSRHQPVESATQSADSWRSSRSASTAKSWISEVREGMNQAQFAKRVDIFNGHESSPCFRNFNIGPDQLPAACRNQSERRLATVRAQLPSLQPPRRRVSSTSPQQSVQWEKERQRSKPRLSQPPSTQEEKYPQDECMTIQNLPQAVSDFPLPAQGAARPPRLSRPCSRTTWQTPQAHCTTDSSACISLPAISDAAQGGSCAWRTHVGEACGLPRASGMLAESSMPLLQHVSEIGRPGGKRVEMGLMLASESTSELEGFHQEQERLHRFRTVAPTGGSGLPGVHANGIVPEISATTDSSFAGTCPEAQHPKPSARPSDAPATMPSQDEGVAFVLDPATEELIAWSQGLQLEDSFSPRSW